MKIIASFPRLMQLASAVGKAKKSGNPQAIIKAQIAHDAYKVICLQADEVATGYTRGAIEDIAKSKYINKNPI